MPCIIYPLLYLIIPLSLFLCEFAVTSRKVLLNTTDGQLTYLDPLKIVRLSTKYYKAKSQPDSYS